ncbi:MAG: glycosyltransferase family 4 protein [Candidatus Omnitrophica bacterium]|nr:glycosyltransferase family 4 protein [Candidatus Omnitrophota bacterium]
MRKPHILLFNRSFWPDLEATGQLLTQLCGELAKNYTVTVIAGRSYYCKEEAFGPCSLFSHEKFEGVNILRVRHTRFWKGSLAGRFMNWITYTALSFIAALGLKPDLIIACTDPPFLGLVAMLISRLKSAPFIFDIQDLYPDAAIGLGKLKHGFLSRTFDFLNRKALNAAKAVVALDEGMKRLLITKGIPNEKIRIVPNWVDTKVIKPAPIAENPCVEKLGLRGKFVIMYLGNIGLTQDFNAVLKALALAEGHLPVFLIFVGEGSAKENLINEVRSQRLKSVIFLPHQPPEALSACLCMAGLHLITLKKGMGGSVVPSKVYSIMASGRPFLAVTDKESEPARLALDFRCGLWAPPDDAKSISEKINWAINHPAELEEMGRAGRRLAESKFDKGIILKEWARVIGKIITLENA